jgi:hypothetical protein
VEVGLAEAFRSRVRADCLFGELDRLRILLLLVLTLANVLPGGV